MKKYLLFLLSAMSCAGSFAQLNVVPAKPQVDETTAPVARLAANVNKAPITPLTTMPVYEQPKGKRIDVSRDGTGYFPNRGSVYPYSTKALASDYVMEEGDSVLWLDEPFTQYESTNRYGQMGWLKLERANATSDFYIAHLPQAVSRNVRFDTTVTNGVQHIDTVYTTFYATKLTGSRNGSYSVSTNQNVRFRMKNGELTQATSNGTEIIGLVTIDGGWLGYGDYGYKLTSNYDTPDPSPLDVPKERYDWRNITAMDGSTTYDGFVNVGFKGDSVYISNPADTTQYFRGIIRGDKAIFKTPQYLGRSESRGRLLYFQGARYTWTDPTRNPTIRIMTDSVTLNFDREARSFTIPNRQALLISINKGDSLYFNLSPEVTIFPFEEKAGKPQPPYFWDPEYYFSNYAWSDRLQMGFGRAYVVVMPYDVNGNYLDPDKLYYSMYIDDDQEPFIFDSIDYHIGNEMTEIPFNFTDNYGITVEGDILRLVAFFTEVQDSIGFQTIYYGGGERNASDIAWYYPNRTDGIAGVKTQRQGVAAYYDLTGRRLNAPGKGVNIVRRRDGSVVKMKY